MVNVSIVAHYNGHVHMVRGGRGWGGHSVHGHAARVGCDLVDRPDKIRSREKERQIVREIERERD